MNDEQQGVEQVFGFGSPEHRKRVRDEFLNIFEGMTDLLAEARTVEFHLRVVDDIRQHVDQHRGMPYDKFAASKFVSDKPKIDRLIKSMASADDQGELQAIRLIAEPLAHANYLDARYKIDEYIAARGLTSMSTEPLPDRSLPSLLDENGELVTYQRQITSSEQNTVVEEFLVFEHQGYARFASDLFVKAKTKFDLEKTAWHFELYMLLRATRPEYKIAEHGAEGPDADNGT